MTAARWMPSAWSRSWPPPRQRAAWALAAAVGLLHVWMLGTWPRSPGPGWRAEPAKAVQVRQINQRMAADTTASPVQAGEPAAVQTAVQSAVQTAVQSAVQTALPPGSSERTDPAAAKGQWPARSPTASSGPTEAEPDADLPAAEASPDPGGQTVPVYATQLPPALTLDFDLRRGPNSGRAQLNWQPHDAHYQLSMQGHVPGAPHLAWTSVGGLHTTGLAPLRYTESRRGRELRAANFQRDAGRVTFSGPQIEYPLVPGGQDRLSWMVQLAAVVAANPELSLPGAQVSIWVVGTRGDADVWTFTVQGRAALDLPVGRVEDTIHLLREPRRPYDTRVQVWLDPARHHLPVQAFLMVRANGLGTEFSLRDLK